MPSVPPNQVSPTRRCQHPSGCWVEFFEDDHRYEWADDRDMEFISATTWIKKFFEKFDREGVSARYADKHGLEQEEVLAAWDAKSAMACDTGNRVHAFAEQLICAFKETGEILDPVESRNLWEIQNGAQDPSRVENLSGGAHLAVSKMSEVLTFEDTELVIASPEVKISGMVDLVVRLNTDKDYPIVGLYDWKTNERLEQSNQWKRGFRPISHLEDCNFNHYALQLNLYEWICRNEGYFSEDTVFQKVIIHLEKDGYKTHKCPNLQREIEAMLGLPE